MPKLILIVSQTSLSLMIVVLALVLMGALFGRLFKTKESLLQHRWSMTVAVILASCVILAVMLPSAFNLFTDPNLPLLSSTSITTFLHSIIGAPALFLGLIYALGDLPPKTKSWMRLAALLWLGSFFLGLLVFLELMGFLAL